MSPARSISIGNSANHHRRSDDASVASDLLVGPESFEQPVQKRGLIRMDPTPGLCEPQKRRLINFPRGTPGLRIGRRFASKAVDAFTTLLIVDRRKGNECAGRQARLFKCLAASRRFQVFSLLYESFRNAPRRTAIVVPRWMHEQNFQSIIVVPIEERAGRFLHRI